MTDTYPIVDSVPEKAPAYALDVPRIKASLKRLEVGAGFIIPAIELRVDGVLRTSPAGQRVYALARVMGIRVSTKKVAEGLRVRREA